MIPSKPFLGSKPWAVVLCKFKDDNFEPHDVSFFRRWITRGNSGINDYFNDVSFGKCNLDGSEVFGWFTLPYTKADDSKNLRQDRIVNAAKAFQDKVDFTQFYGICIVTNVDQDSGALSTGVIPIELNGKIQDYGVVVLGPWGLQPSVACQEFSHAFKLINHTRNAANPTADYGNPFDIMSTLSNCYMFRDQRNDLCGPGMNSPNLDEFGWIDSDRIFQVPKVISHNSLGINYLAKQVFYVQLSALNHPETDNQLCVTIEASSASVGPFTYYIEYRTADGWDRGMADSGIQDCIVIEQSRPDEYNYLIFPTTYTNCLQGGQSFYDSENEITVQVLSFNSHVAILQITLPVWQVFKTPVDGPGRTDWHIYEMAIEQIEVAAIHSMRSIVNIMQQQWLIAGKGGGSGRPGRGGG